MCNGSKCSNLLASSISWPSASAAAALVIQNSEEPRRLKISSNPGARKDLHENFTLSNDFDSESGNNSKWFGLEVADEVVVCSLYKEEDLDWWKREMLEIEAMVEKPNIIGTTLLSYKNLGPSNNVCFGHNMQNQNMQKQKQKYKIDNNACSGWRYQRYENC